MSLDLAEILQRTGTGQKPPDWTPGSGPVKVSLKHNEIMDYMIANPTVRLQDVAARFSVTPSWLSQVIHSDAFQALLAKKQEVAFNHTVLPLRDKMSNIAHVALDKLAERLPDVTDVDSLSDVAANMLDRLGFGSKGNSVPVPPSSVLVASEQLTAARQLILERKTTRLEVGIAGNRVTVLEESATLVGEAGNQAAFPYIEGEVSEAPQRREVRGEGT